MIHSIGSQRGNVKRFYRLQKERKRLLTSVETGGCVPFQIVKQPLSSSSSCLSIHPLVYPNQNYRQWPNMEKDLIGPEHISHPSPFQSEEELLKGKLKDDERPFDVGAFDCLDPPSFHFVSLGIRMISVVHLFLCRSSSTILA